MNQQRIILIAVAIGFLATLVWAWRDLRPATAPAASVAVAPAQVPAAMAPTQVPGAPQQSASSTAEAVDEAALPAPAAAGGNDAPDPDPMQEPAERKFAQGGKQTEEGSGE